MFNEFRIRSIKNDGDSFSQFGFFFKITFMRKTCNLLANHWTKQIVPKTPDKRRTQSGLHAVWSNPTLKNFESGTVALTPHGTTRHALSLALSTSASQSLSLSLSVCVWRDFSRLRLCCFHWVNSFAFTSLTSLYGEPNSTLI